MSLPENVIHEILVRLKKDLRALFRCALTCKRWSRLVAEARGGPDHTSSSFLSGFFIRKRLGVFCTDRSSMTSLVPMPQWLFEPHRRFLGSFFPETAAGGHLGRGRAVPLVARHGLLLARLPSSDVEIDRSRGGRISIVHLVVCNPLAGTWDVLPPLASSWRYRDRTWRSWKYGDAGYAIFTEADRRSSSNVNQRSSTPLAGYSPLFKVLVTYTNGVSCVLNTFSSGEARWNAPIKVDTDARKFSILGALKHPNAVVCHGAAHWLVSSSRHNENGMHTVQVDAQTGRVTATEIVILIEKFCSGNYDEPQLGVTADGRLSLLYLQRPGLRLHVLVPQDGGGPTGWVLGHVVELEPPERRTTSILGEEAAHLTFIGEKCGTLLVRDSNMRMYAVDRETGRMTELTFCGRVDRWKVVPFDIYWPTSNTV